MGLLDVFLRADGRRERDPLVAVVTGRSTSCELSYEGNECHRPEGHSGLCYDERTRVAFEDGWWGDDRGNTSESARTQS